MADGPQRVAVFGASGYTGSRVAAALAARGHSLLLVGRSRARLEPLAAGLPGTAEVEEVDLADRGGLSRICESSALVVNAIGPFGPTAGPLVDAVIEAGKPYLDCSAEQAHAVRLFERHQEWARDTGALLVPGLAFFHAVADFLAAAAAARAGADGPFDSVEVGYAVRGWQATRGTLGAREEGVSSDWFVYDGGLRRVEDRTAMSWFDFPAPVGRQRVVAYPIGDVVSIPRHVPARRVTSGMTVTTLVPPQAANAYPTIARGLELLSRSPLRPVVKRVLAGGALLTGEAGDPSRFTVAVELRRGQERIQAWASGRQIYGISAPLLAEAAARLLDSGAERPSGVQAPSQVVSARAMLERLGELDEFEFTFEVPDRAASVTEVAASG